MSLRWRAIWIAATVLLFGYYALANFASQESRLDSLLLPDSALRLGLDLRGGIHLVLQVQTDDAIKAELDDASLRLSSVAADKGLNIGGRREDV